MVRLRQLFLFLLSVQLAVTGARADATEARTLLSARLPNIVSVMGDMGFTLNPHKGPDGTDMLEDSQQRFFLLLGLCETASCRLVQVRKCLAVAKASPEIANRWNSSQMFGRASTPSPGVMCIDATLHAADGLVSMAQLRSLAEGVIGASPVAERFFAEG